MSPLFRWALCVPRAWRVRYARELEALLDDLQPGCGELWDVFKGGLTMRITTWSSVPVACAGCWWSHRRCRRVSHADCLRVDGDHSPGGGSAGKPQRVPPRRPARDRGPSAGGSTRAAAGDVGDAAPRRCRSRRPCGSPPRTRWPEQARRVTTGLTTGRSSQARPRRRERRRSWSRRRCRPLLSRRRTQRASGPASTAGLALGCVALPRPAAPGTRATWPEDDAKRRAGRRGQPLQQAEVMAPAGSRIVATRPTLGTSHAASMT